MLKKYSFSLLEILLAVSLLSVSSLFIIFQLNHVLKEVEFRKQMEFIKGNLLLARQLSIAFDVDVTMRFSQHKEGVLYEFLIDPPIVDVKKWVISQQKMLKGIEAISLEGNMKKIVDIDISNKGLIAPKGSLIFFHGNTQGNISLSCVS